MTDPRRILPGKIYLVTRRCTQRQFLLRPSRLTNRIVEYCLGLAVEETGVQVHAFCVMSNHWHGVLSDPFARLPEFLERFHRLVAKAQNAALERWENFWSSDKTSVVELTSETDVIEKIAYTIANPTTAGLVKTPDHWPGLTAWRFGARPAVEMPTVFFDGGGDLPDEAVLTIVRPEIFALRSDQDLLTRIGYAIADLVRKARARAREEGTKFIGPCGVLRQSFLATPVRSATRRRLNPRIAAASAALRVAALSKLREFMVEYRAAWHAWRAGDRSAIFPAGTYALRRRACVICAPYAGILWEYSAA